MPCPLLFPLQPQKTQALVVPWNKTSPDFPPCPRGEKGKPKGTAQGAAGGWQEQRNLLAFCILQEKVKNAPGTQQQLLLASSAHPAGTQDLGFDPKEGDEEASSLPAERSTDGSRRPSSFFIFLFFFCAPSHDRFCCLTQDFFGRSGLARPMSCFVFLSEKFKCFGGNKVPSSDRRGGEGSSLFL